MSTDLLGGPSLDDSTGPADDGDAGRGGGGTRTAGWAAAVVLVVALGAALRLQSPSELWLDEAISVNISGLPLGEVAGALRRDGAPPLYPLLLWGWERLVGDGTTAVRLLSALFGVSALAAAALAGARLAGRVGGVAAMLLLATSPFAVYYSSEARPYSLVVLLVLCGFLALDSYLRQPRAARGVLVAVASAALALTHYWSLFLLAVVAVGLVVRARQMRSSSDVRAVGWMAAGGLLFLPWLPTFLYQLAHTGTPWALPRGFAMVLTTVSEWSGGAGSPQQVLAVTLLVLAGVGASAVAASGSRLEIDLRGRPPGRALAFVVVGTLVLGLAVGRLTGAAFVPRYTTVALPVFLLLAALGVARLPRRAGTAILAVAVVTGLAGALPYAFFSGKTQAPVVAEALTEQALPGDVVVYCPDQLGPAVSRLLPESLRQEVYPTGGPPARVDWVDYQERNRSADPAAYARELSSRAGRGAVWLVTSSGYRTFGKQCETLLQTLTQLRGAPLLLVEADGADFEPASVRGWAPIP
jgi:mannosyltransferase